MAVEYERPLTGANCFVQQSCVMAVEKRNLLPLKVQRAEPFMQPVLRRGHHAAEPRRIVDVSGHKVRREAIKQRNDRRTDVAAMDRQARAVARRASMASWAEVISPCVSLSTPSIMEWCPMIEEADLTPDAMDESPSGRKRRCNVE